MAKPLIKSATKLPLHNRQKNPAGKAAEQKALYNARQANLGKAVSAVKKLMGVVGTGKKIGEPPPCLKEDGREAWFKVRADLTAIGINDAMDEFAIMMFCSALDEYMLAMHAVETEGRFLTLQGERGSEKRVAHPGCAIMSNAWARMRSLITEIYLTPLSRLKSSPKKDDGGITDPFANFLNGN